MPLQQGSSYKKDGTCRRALVFLFSAGAEYSVFLRFFLRDFPCSGGTASTIFFPEGPRKICFPPGRNLSRNFGEPLE